MAIFVTRSELALRLGELLDTSLQQPIIVRKFGLAKNVLLSFGEYERLIGDSQKLESLRATINSLEETSILKSIFRNISE